MQQGKPLGLAKNARGGICPAGRDRTYGGMPVGQAASEITAFSWSMVVSRWTTHYGSILTIAFLNP